jgi:hypothetical protein
MAHVWKESEKSLKYFKLCENKSFGFIHLFYSTLLTLDGYWTDYGQKERGQAWGSEKKVERRVCMMKVVYKYISL